jgi:hypothetical protein
LGILKKHKIDVRKCVNLEQYVLNLTWEMINRKLEFCIGTRDGDDNNKNKKTQTVGRVGLDKNR